MTRFFFQIILIISSSFGFAQYAVRDYKNPVFNLKMMDIGFEQKGQSIQYQSTVSVQDRKAVAGNIQPNFWMQRSNERNIFIAQLGLSETYEFNKFNLELQDGFRTASQWKNNSSLNYFSSFTRYLKGDFFSKVGVTGNNGFEYNNLKNRDVSYLGERSGVEEKNRSINGNVNPSVGVGFGRVFDSGDAQLTHYIIEDIREICGLTRDLSPQEFQEITEWITHIKNQRVFDFRKKRIYEITQLDSILQRMNFIENTDVNYYTSLYDNWLYAYRQPRYNGWVTGVYYAANFESEIETEMSTYWKNVDNENITIDKTQLENTTYDWSHCAVAYGGYFVPVSNALQFNVSQYVYLMDERVEIMEKERLGIYTRGIVQLLYYPNSRTEFGIKANGYSSIYSLSNVEANTSIHANYFIAPQLRFNGMIAFRKEALGIQSYQFSAGFNYFVF